MDLTHSAHRKHAANRGGRTDLVLFASSFIVFLAIALVGQLLGRPWRTWLPGAEGVGLFGGVKAAVYTYMPYLF